MISDLSDIRSSAVSAVDMSGIARLQGDALFSCMALGGLVCYTQIYGCILLSYFITSQSSAKMSVWLAVHGTLLPSGYAG